MSFPHNEHLQMNKLPDKKSYTIPDVLSSFYFCKKVSFIVPFISDKHYESNIELLKYQPLLRWQQEDPPQHWITATRLQGIITQKKAIFRVWHHDKHKSDKSLLKSLLKFSMGAVPHWDHYMLDKHKTTECISKKLISNQWISTRHS
jgi:hypothetical protein